MLFPLFLAMLVPEDAGTRAAESAVAVSRLCHIPAERLSIVREGEYDFALLSVNGTDRLSDGQLRCYGNVLVRVDGVFPQFEDPALGARYQRLAVLDRRFAARADLRARGLLKRLPRYREGKETLATFALRLERLCGATPGSVLRVEENRIDLTPTTDSPSSGDPAKNLCAIHAAILAGHDPLIVPEIPLVMPEAQILLPETPTPVIG